MSADESAPTQAAPPDDSETEQLPAALAAVGLMWLLINRSRSSRRFEDETQLRSQDGADTGRGSPPGA